MKRMFKSKIEKRVEEIKKLERRITLYKSMLKETIPSSYMFLDGYIVDKVTFETIREATQQECDYFYGIRRAELKIKEIKK